MSESELLETGLLDEVEIEAFAKRGEKPPRARRYQIRVDREKFVVEVPSMTGSEILELSGKPPATHRLYLHARGAQATPVAANQTVDFTAPGVERFTTMPLDPTEGAGGPR